MPGRKPSVLASLFKSVASGDLKIPKVKCNFCGTNITKNGSRMKKHILNCKHCTDNIRAKYLKHSGGHDSDQDEVEPIDCEPGGYPEPSHQSTTTSQSDCGQTSATSRSSPTPKALNQSLDRFLGGPPPSTTTTEQCLPQSSTPSSTKKTPNLCRSRSTTPTSKAAPDICFDKMSGPQNVSIINNFQTS
jgi:hypothetical protein